MTLVHAEDGAASRALDVALQARRVRWWSAAFVGVPLIAATLTLLYGHDDSWWAIGAATLIPICWFLTRAKPLRSTRTAHVFAVVLIGILGTAVAISPNMAVLQALVYPYVWTVFEAIRNAVIANLAVAVTVGIGLSIGFSEFMAAADAIGQATAIAILSLAFSLAFGSWISRIAEWGEERARLLDELTAAQGALELAHRDAGGASERGRIARELHDTLAQSLTGLVMLSQRAGSTARGDELDLDDLRRQIAVIEEVSREALAEARTVVASESAVSVDGGFEHAARRLAERFERETGITVATSVDGQMSRELEVVVLRCAQEALANIRKHAAASAAAIGVAVAAGAVTLTVTDNGRGVDEATLDAASGFGLPGMRDRLALVDGTLEVGQNPSGGTRLVVTVPERGHGG